MSDDTFPNSRPSTTSAFYTLTGLGVFGLLCVSAYSIRATGLAAIAESVVVALLTAVCSGSVGGLLGFLFGIPRTREGADVPEGEAVAGVGISGAVYRPNTNLEQISDWLTKILVGVGLTQIPAISAWFVTISAAAASGLGGSDASRVVASTMIVYFLVCGFLFGFLWTRLYLPRAFREADLGVITRALGQSVQEVKATFDRQAEADARALSLVQRQLYLSPDSPEVPQEELNEAVTSASLPVKVQVFNRAQNARAATWKDETKKPAMERTIRVFRALIAADVEKKFHKNHGQLGFALKDMRTPDWKSAEAELTIAIDLRAASKQDGWLFYEFCRAVCRIQLDADFQAKRPSSASMRDAVLADLRAAATEELRHLVIAEPVVEAWIKLNGVQV